MTQVELLQHLRKIELQLRSPEAQECFREQDEAVRRRVQSLRLELSAVIGHLTNAQLAAIAGRLEELTDELQTGMREVELSLERLQSIGSIIRKVSTVLGLAARVAVAASGAAG